MKSCGGEQIHQRCAFERGWTNPAPIGPTLSEIFCLTCVLSLTVRSVK